MVVVDDCMVYLLLVVRPAFRPRGPTPSGFAYEIYKSHDLKIDL